MFRYYLHKLNPLRLIRSSHSGSCFISQHVSGRVHRVSHGDKWRTFEEIGQLIWGLESEDDGFEFDIISRCGHQFPHINRFNVWSASKDTVNIELIRVQDVGEYVSHQIEIPRSEFGTYSKNIDGVINYPQEAGFKQGNI